MKIGFSIIIAMMGLVAFCGQANGQTIVFDESKASEEDKKIYEALLDAMRRAEMKTALVESADHRIAKTFSTGDKIDLKYSIRSNINIEKLWWASVESLQINGSEISEQTSGFTDINSALKDFYRMDVDVRSCLVRPGESECGLYEVVFRGLHRSPPVGHKGDMQCIASFTLGSKVSSAEMKCNDFQLYPKRK